MRVVSLKKENILLVLYLAIIIPGVIGAYIFTSHHPAALEAPVKTVIIDPGHGGQDPGMVSGKILEKNINLKISLKLKKYLEQSGYKVIMTREDDDDLPKNKQSDMYKRKLIANGSNADIFVSIHQNSHSNSNSKGAQAFYYIKSEKSKQLAECIQAQIKTIANPSNRMKSQSNADYYVLRQTVMPAVIVECGFMSNSGERWKLTTDEYQENMAWAIYTGIAKYFEVQTGGKSLE